MRERRSGAAERAAVLDELVRRHEGLGAGVKEVLQRAADPADARLSRRSRAGGRHVPRQRRGGAAWSKSPWAKPPSTSSPPKVDELFDYLQTESNRLGGRVGFVWLERRGQNVFGVGAAAS